MCRFCEGSSSEREIFIEPMSGDWYMDYRTSEWDNMNDDYIHDKIFISYCPYCGRKLEDDTETN